MPRMFTRDRSRKGNGNAMTIAIENVRVLTHKKLKHYKRIALCEIALLQH